MGDKFTPGPWKLEDGLPCVIRTEDETLAQAFFMYGDKDRDVKQSEANARLIAAAPELLAALKEARKCVAWCRKNHRDEQYGEGIPIEHIWDALIAKVEL